MIDNFQKKQNEYLQKLKGMESDFAGLEFCTDKDGFKLSVLEWTKMNDTSLVELEKVDSEYISKFLQDLVKFNDYLVIGSSLDSGNLIALYQPTGEIFELEHEDIDSITRYFVNTDAEKLYRSANAVQQCGMECSESEEDEEKHNELFAQLRNELQRIDGNVKIDDDQHNNQFWNSTYHMLLE